MGAAPPVQGGILAVAGPAAGMTALALNISGLYPGPGVAGARGGVVIDAVIDVADVRYPLGRGRVDGVVLGADVVALGIGASA